MSVYQGGRVESPGVQYRPVEIKKLGEGSFGIATLYKLDPPITKENGEVRDYVVRKMAHNNREAIKLLVQEIRFLRTMASFKDLRDRQHPFLTSLELSTVHQNPPYADMQYGRYGPAHEVQTGTYTAQQGRRFLGQMLDALVYLHEKLSIIHMDIKPDNIVVTRKHADGSMDFIMIDFGVAKQRTLGQAYQVVSSSGGGTMAYMAPDIFRSKFGAGVDIWSLGIAAYELMRGKNPINQLFLADRYADQRYNEFHLAMWADFNKEHLEKSSKLVVYLFILKHMLHPDPESRPTARKCYAMLGCHGTLATDNLLSPDQKRVRERKEKERKEKDRKEKEKEEEERRRRDRERQDEDGRNDRRDDRRDDRRGDIRRGERRDDRRPKNEGVREVGKDDLQMTVELINGRWLTRWSRRSST